MFRFGRGRLPFLPLLFLVAIAGYAIAGAAGAALGFVLFLPVKLFFFMFLFGMFFRVAGGGPWRGRGRGGLWAPPREPTQDERQRAEAERRARDEVDTLFPDL